MKRTDQSQIDAACKAFQASALSVRPDGGAFGPGAWPGTKHIEAAIDAYLLGGGAPEVIRRAFELLQASQPKPPTRGTRFEDNVERIADALDKFARGIGDTGRAPTPAGLAERYRAKNINEAFGPNRIIAVEDAVDRIIDYLNERNT